MATVEFVPGEVTEYERHFTIQAHGKEVGFIILDNDGTATVESSAGVFPDATLSNYEKAERYVLDALGEAPVKQSPKRATRTTTASKAPKEGVAPKAPKTPKTSAEPKPKAEPRVRREVLEAQQGRIRLRFNQAQTAALNVDIAETPVLRNQLDEALAERQYYKDDTMVIYVLPELAHFLLEWSEGQEGIGFKAGSKAMRAAMEKQGVKPRELVAA